MKRRVHQQFVAVCGEKSVVTVRGNVWCCVMNVVGWEAVRLGSGSVGRLVCVCMRVGRGEGGNMENSG